MLQKKNEGILFSAEIRVVGSYTDRLLTASRLPVSMPNLYPCRFMEFPRMTVLVSRMLLELSETKAKAN